MIMNTMKATYTLWTLFHDLILSRAFIHWADARLTESRKVSKPRDSSLDFSNRFEIWQAPRQQRCRDACQILQRYDDYNIQYRSFETWSCGKTSV